MAELLRDLVVSLSLDSGNFTANIKTIGVLLKQAQSEFNLAKAGVKNFEGSLTGMQASLNLLKNRLDLQKEAVTQYANRLSAAQSKLQQATANQTKYAEKLSSAKESLAMWKEQQQKLNEQLSTATAHYGANSSLVQTLQRAYETAKGKVQAYEEEIKKLSEQYSKEEAATRKASDAVHRAQTDYNNAKASVASLEAEINKLSSSLKTSVADFTLIGNALQNIGDKVSGIGDKVSKVGKTLSLAVTTPVTVAGKAALSASMDFESAFTTVRQVTNASESTYEDWSNAVKQMAEETGIASASIASTMAEAGRLGVQNENLVTFTKSALDLGQAFNMSATEAATSMARFFNIMGTSQDQVTSFGSATTYLANNYATTAEEIMEMAKGLAGAARTIGMSEQDVLGVSTALTSLGITAGRGATTFSQALIKMETSAQTGDKYLEDFATVCGMTGKQFQDAWKVDPTGVFEKFLLGLSKMTEEDESAIAALQDCGIKTARLTDTLLRAAGAEEIIVSAIGDANSAWQEGAELTNVANKRYQTTAIKLANLKNNFKNLLITIGDDLTPLANKFIDFANGVINSLDSISPQVRTTIETIAGIAAAVGPVLIAFGMLTKGIGNGIHAIGSMIKGVGNAFTAISGLLSSVELLPIVLAAVGVAAVYTFGQWVTGAYQAKAVMDELNKTVDEWAENVQTSFESSRGLSAFGLSDEDFQVGNTDSGSSWLTSTIETWTDGKKETDQIVSETVKSFTDGTDEIRTALEQLNGSGEGGSTMDGLTTDLSTLSDIDKEVEKILQNKQNGFLSEDEIARLQELIDQREAIKIKYTLVSDVDSSFGSIVQGVESALSRGADGKSVFSDAFAGATEGLGAFTKSLNAEYDAQYAVIAAMEEGTDEQIAEKKKKFEELKEWYNTQAAAAQSEYYKTVITSAEKTGVYGEDGTYGEAAKQLEHIRQLMSDAARKDEKSQEVQALNKALSELDESTIVEMDSSLTALQAAAEATGTSLPTDIQNCVDALEAVKTAATGVDGVFSEGTTAALQSMFGGLSQESYEVYASLNCDNLTTAYDAWAAGEHAEIIPEIDTTTVDYNGTVSVDGTLINVTTPDGGTFTVSNFKVDVGGNLCYVSSDGTYTVAEGLKVDVDGQLTYVGPDGEEHKVVGANVTADGTLASVTTEDGKTYVTEFVDVNGKLKSVVLTDDTEIPEIEVPAKISFEKGYSNSKDTELEYTSGDRGVTESFSLNKSEDAMTYATYLSEFANAIQEYNAAMEEADPATAQMTYATMEQYGSNFGNFMSSGKGFEAFAQYIANGLQLLSEGKLTPEEAQELLTTIADLQTVLNDPTASSITSGFTGDKSFAGGLASLLGGYGWEGLDSSNLSDSLTSAVEGAKSDAIEAGSDFTAGIGEGESSYDFSSDAEAAVANNEDAIRTAADSHSPAQRFVPVGNDISAGIGQGLGQYDFSADAMLVATNLMASVGSAMTVGSAQVAESASAVVASISSAMSTADTDTTSIGYNLMDGIAVGIANGKSNVINAAVDVVKEAIKKAKEEGGIFSPSRVMRDEVGVMLARGMGVGIDQEAKRTAKTMANATRYVIDSARGYASGSTVNNTRNYNNSDNSINISVDGMSVRDDSDVRSIAVEIASLTRRNHQLKGVLA